MSESPAYETAPGDPGADALFAEPESARPQGAPLALYRRYRPDTFADLIGQDHVTEPLQRALVNNRVNHAYLFSGPRGCGKTTSARILARALNCEQGPTPTPCGECQSCRDLARGGPGSIDVIEIDAASHGGVEDARDLRERAFFAPVNSRYKVYIVDEAHMVTSAGFNALLKLVEEPPPHVKFVFATTEPDKVIGTIRSRTHHYPFRLVPPKTLTAYLAQLCEAEQVPVDDAVLPLVVRAGAGSVRDSLSVLDQLLGGAAETGVSYEQAAALLGFTPDSLLDEILDAIAAGDAGGVFAAVDKVIEVGQDPRRFAEDLLRRLRDLVIVAAVPDAVTNGLVEVSGDQAERLQNQAAALGAGELTRAAEVIANGLTEMRGTTAPRLHLELMCSRVLLPEADLDGRGLHARIDRLERRVGMNAGTASPAAGAPVQPTAPASIDHGVPAGTPNSGADVPAGTPVDPSPGTPGPAAAAVADPGPAVPPGAESRAETAAGDGGVPAGTPTASVFTGSAPVDSVQADAVPAAEAEASQGWSTADVRRLWPDVLEAVKKRRRFTWILLSQNSQVVEVVGTKITLGMANTGARDNFAKGGSEEVLIEALVEQLGTQFTVQAIVDPGGGSGGGGAGRPAPPSDPFDAPARQARQSESPPISPSTNQQTGPANPAGPPAGAPEASGPISPDSAPSASAPSGFSGGSSPGPAPAASATAASAPPASHPVNPHPTSPHPNSPHPNGVRPSGAHARAARESIRGTRYQGSPASPGEQPGIEPDEAEIVDRDDDVIDDGFESQTELLMRHLGAEIITEDADT